MKIHYSPSRSSIVLPTAARRLLRASIQARSLTFLTLLFLFAACGSKAERDQARFEKDPAALTNVRRIQTLLSRSQTIQQNDLDLLETIHTKYPDATEVRQTFQNALQARQDWGALEKLLTERPEFERTSQEQVVLARVYIKLGRYHDASRIVGPMADASPNDLELNGLAGHAWFYEGKYADAARAIDRVWDALIGAKQVDQIMMRGMIYYYTGDKNRAIDTLKKTLEIKPDYVPGSNALSRVYAAMGDQKQAEVYRAQAERAHALNTADETRRMRVISRSRDLENAFAAGRYEESILIAREMLQTADDSQKPVLYEYIGKSYQATGQQTEAQAAFQDAARLRGPGK